jgi:hypothetical protein
MGQWNKYMPWRAPGTSKPLDACGIASGFSPTAAVQYPHKFKDTTIKQGAKGTELLAGQVTVWAPGATVQASYRLVVNHGGGYQYRVCPKTELPTEACFQANALAFANSKTTVVYNTGKRITLNAVDVTTGVQPAGHAWRRLPLPACNCDLGTGCSNTTLKNAQKGDNVAYQTGITSHGHCSHGLQFAAPHLTDGTWTDGFGYFVARLGGDGTRSGKETASTTDACFAYGDESACKTYASSGCAWYTGKGCYTGKAAATDVCGKIKDQTGCEAASSKSSCVWHAAKTTCYDPATVKSGKTMSKTDDKGTSGGGFSGAGTKDESVHQWWVTDELIAPSKVGDYILQWRWDNEQTPQIWTTCADIRVAQFSSSGHGLKAGGVVDATLILLVAIMTTVF